MLKNGIKNVIAIEGSKIPDAVVELTKQKTTTAFLDGDRGGDLDLKKLLLIADIDFIARAEEGKEVEELTKKQIYKALREKIAIGSLEIKEELHTETREIIQEKPSFNEETKNLFANLLDELTGSRAAYLVSSDMQVIAKVPISELGSATEEYDNIHAIIFDGKINKDIIELSLQKGIPYLVATDYKEQLSVPDRMVVLTQKDFE